MKLEIKQTDIENLKVLLDWAEIESSLRIALTEPVKSSYKILAWAQKEFSDRVHDEATEDGQPKVKPL